MAIGPAGCTGGQPLYSVARDESTGDANDQAENDGPRAPDPANEPMTET